MLDAFTPEIDIIRTPQRLRVWLAGALVGTTHIAVDLEGHGTTMLCVGLGVRRRGCCVVLINEKTGARQMSYEDELETHRILADLFIEPSITKVFHNGYSYDVPELQRRGFVVNNWADTMIMHHTKYADLPHKLRFIGSVYTRMAPWKGEGKEVEEELDK